MPPAKPKQKPAPATGIRPPSNTKNRRDVKGVLDFEREERLPKVAAMYVRGKVQADIAKELGVSRQTVTDDLAIIRTRWRESEIRDFDSLRSEQLAKVDTVEAEYWVEWERSKAQATRKTSERRDGVDRASVTVEDQTGDPRYLQGVERCIERRCKLLGLDAPTRSEVSGPGGGPIVSETRQPMTPEEVRLTYAAIFNQVAESVDHGDAGDGLAQSEPMDSPPANG